jgi:hypothetical protein
MSNNNTLMNFYAKSLANQALNKDINKEYHYEGLSTITYTPKDKDSSTYKNKYSMYIEKDSDTRNIVSVYVEDYEQDPDTNTNEEIRIQSVSIYNGNVEYITITDDVSKKLLSNEYTQRHILTKDGKKCIYWKLPFEEVFGFEHINCVRLAFHTYQINIQFTHNVKCKKICAYTKNLHLDTQRRKGLFFDVKDYESQKMIQSKPYYFINEHSFQYKDMNSIETIQKLNTFMKGVCICIDTSSFIETPSIETLEITYNLTLKHTLENKHSLLFANQQPELDFFCKTIPHKDYYIYYVPFTTDLELFDRSDMENSVYVKDLEIKMDVNVKPNTNITIYGIGTDAILYASGMSGKKSDIHI